jgi:hypothetical protein
MEFRDAQLEAALGAVGDTRMIDTLDLELLTRLDVVPEPDLGG